MLDADGMGDELDKQLMLTAGWPAEQVAFQGEKQYNPNKRGACSIYWGNGSALCRHRQA